MNNQRVVIVTGGIGSGKSTLCKLLGEKGAMLYSLDEVSRDLLRSNEDMVAELAQEFGPQILDEDGAVIPAELAAAAFADDASTQAMNAITMPYIVQAATNYILASSDHCVPLSSAPALVVEVPLLTEVPELAALADEVIAVEADPEVRLERCIARGMNIDDAMARINRQPDDAQRRQLATTICDNSGSEEDLSTWASAWWEKLDK